MSASTNLIQAIRSDDQAAIRSQLKAGAFVAARDPRGNTPLHWAALANDPRLVKQLLAAGADARATNNAGADPNAKSLSGASPLHTAAARPGLAGT